MLSGRQPSCRRKPQSNDPLLARPGRLRRRTIPSVIRGTRGEPSHSYDTASVGLLARSHFAARRIGSKHRIMEAADTWRNWVAVAVDLKQSPAEVDKFLLSQHRIVE